MHLRNKMFKKCHPLVTVDHVNGPLFKEDWKNRLMKFNEI